MSEGTDTRAQFPEIAELVDRLRAAGFAPRVTHILDHDGNVLLGGQAPDAWRQEMAAWAKEPAPTRPGDPAPPPTPYRGRRRA